MFRISQAGQLSLGSKRCIPQIPVFIKKKKICIPIDWKRDGKGGVETGERDEGNEGNKERSNTKEKSFQQLTQMERMQRFTLSPADKWYLKREM